MILMKLERMLTGLKKGIATAVLASSLFFGCSDENPVQPRAAASSPKQNSPPVFVSSPITNVNEKEMYSYQLKATDADGDKLTYSLIKKPIWLSISTSGMVSGLAPEISSDIYYNVEASVSDGKKLVSQKYNLTVKNKTEDIPQTSDTSGVYLLSAGQVGGLIVSENSLSFTQPVNFTANDIIGSGITSSTPHGLLRKVTSISSDKKTVYTEQATLEEAIKDGSFEYKGRIPSSGAVFIPAKKGMSLSKSAASVFDFTLDINNVVIYDFDNNPNTTDDRLIADGKISFNMDYELKGKVNKISLEELLFKIIATEKCEIKVKSSDSFMGFVADIPLGEFSLPSFSIGNMPTPPYLPLIVYPKLEVNMKFFGGIKPLETKVSQEAVFTAGLSYNRGQWLPIWDFSNSFSFTPPTLDPAPFSFYVKAGPKIKFPLYNVAGPDVDLLSKIDFESSLKKWSLYGGVESNAGVEMKIFKRVFADFSVPLFTYKELLAEGTFSPIEGEILFTKTKSGGNAEVYVMKSDGSQQINLTNNSANDYDPSWSPDKKKIVFVSDRDGNSEIYTANQDGTAVKRLTNSPGIDRMPDWSPDGKEIVYYSEQYGNEDIFLMNSDGTNQRKLNVPFGVHINPTWSPDGNKIAFSSTLSGKSLDIYTVNKDGTSLERLTTTSSNDVEPVWSPDGNKIAFSSNQAGYFDIWVMNRDGSNKKNLSVTEHSTDDMHPTWSPDGTRIAYTFGSFSLAKIYVMNSDGSHGVPEGLLSDDLSSDDRSPSWSPK